MAPAEAREIASALAGIAVALALGMNRMNLFALLALAACGSVEGMPPDVVDHSADAGGPPAVVAVSPPTGSVVEEQVAIAFAFSQPMDRASVEAAIEFPGAGAPSFAWNADDTEVTASRLVPYADGTDPDQVNLRAFQVTLSAGATDAGGQPLADQLVLDYPLRYKRITAVFPFSQTLSGNCFAACAGTWTWLAAGERSADPAVATRAFLTIPFDTLPDGVLIDGAVLHTEIEATQDNPFAWGDLSIDDVTFAAINADAYGKRGNDLGVLFAASPVPGIGAAVSLDVTDAFADDYEHRVARQNRTQFRIRFPHDMPEDPEYTSAHSDGAWDLVQLLRTATDVTVTYLVE